MAREYLVEIDANQRTAQSQPIANQEAFGSWTTTNVTPTSNTTANPVNAAVTADTLSDGVSAGEHYVSQTPTVHATGTHCFSVYAKYVDRQYLGLLLDGTESRFDLVNKTVVDFEGNWSLQAGIEDLGGGWVRCWTYKTIATTTPVVRIAMRPNQMSTSYTGSSKTVILFGAQMNPGTAPLAYGATIITPTATTLRYSALGYCTRRSDTPSDTDYPPRIADPGALRLALFSSARTRGDTDVGYGEIVLHNRDGGLDALVDYGFAGCAIRVKSGQKDAALSAFTTVFVGTVEQATFGLDDVRIMVRDRTYEIANNPLCDGKFAGSNSGVTGVEGEADLAGVVKPKVFGKVTNIPVTKVNNFYLIYHVADSDLTSVDVYDSGIQLLTGEMSRANLTNTTPTLGWTFTTADVNTTNDTIDVTTTGMSSTWTNGDTVFMVKGTGGSDVLPTPFVDNQVYYVNDDAGANILKFYDSWSKAVRGDLDEEINITAAGTGTSSLYREGTDLNTNATWKTVGTASISTTNDTFTVGAGHGLANGDMVVVRKANDTGTMPAPLIAYNIYYARQYQGTSSTAFQFHPTRPDALANTNKINLTSVGSADNNEFSANFVPPGKAAFCHDAQGTLIRLGSVPSGQVTVDCATGTAAAERTPAQLIKSIGLDAGIASGDIIAGDVTALDALCPQEVGIYVTGDTTPLAAMDEIAGSVGAWYAFDLAGDLRMGRVVAPSGSAAISITDSDVIAIERIRPSDSGRGVVPWKVTVRHSRSYVQQVDSDLASGVTESRKVFVAREYRDATVENSAVKDIEPGAPTMSVDTLLTTTSEATSEASRLLALYSTRRDMYRVTVPVSDAVLAVRVGQVVDLTYPRFGLNSTKKFLLVAVEVRWGDNVVDMTLWG